MAPFDKLTHFFGQNFNTGDFYRSPFDAARFQTRQNLQNYRRFFVGNERKRLLEKAGYNYDEVQSYVNGLFTKGGYKSNGEVAREVIKGVWGVGKERKNRLEKAGYDYNEIQKLVNQMLG